MIKILSDNKSLDAAILVEAALKRSVGITAVSRITKMGMLINKPQLLVVIDPDPDTARFLIKHLEQNKIKLILLGKLPENLLDYLGLYEDEWPNLDLDWSRSKSALPNQVSESSGTINYNDRAGLLGFGEWQRALERFDFSDEWNNLGFGRITTDRSIWSLAQPIKGGSDVIAEIMIPGTDSFAFASLIDRRNSSVLWFNRAVGVIDSFEWRLVERFLSSWKYKILPCLPVFLEIPWGYDAAVTMRLDCDEDVASSEILMNAYLEMDIPFSLAIHTSLLEDERNVDFVKTALKKNVAILSHTQTHAPNWGGSYSSALAEAKNSALALIDLTGTEPHFCVAPFHHAPDFALHALSDSGYLGCIGGIIKNDPEFLIARGGILAELPQGFVGHSQQHMLHGDCISFSDDPIKTYKLAYDMAAATKTIFGYLDHPFSDRYTYGWTDENQRLMIHKLLIEYIRGVKHRAVFMSETEVLSFLLYKGGFSSEPSSDGFILTHNNDFSDSTNYFPTVEYGDIAFKAKAGAKIK